MDLEASPEHLSRGTARHADVLILVAEPYFRSLEAVRLQARLAAELPDVTIGVIANKLRNPEDGQAVSEFVEGLGIPLWGRIPWSDDVMNADRVRASLVDSAPNSPAVEGIKNILGILMVLKAERTCV